MAWIEPIYDRTLQDVNNIKELVNRLRSGYATESDISTYATDLKGAINKSDLERIVGNMDYLAHLLDVSISTQTVPEIPRVSWYSTLLSNLHILLDAYTKHSDTPDIPVQPLNDYVKWNIIEKIIWDINDIYSSNEFYFAGNDELYGDDDILI